ncbi:MAG TPA: excinuclease ABC subunit UvrA [Candidatus Limnocylindria bacterium]|nr:excinuclease ABC subunit UvrA [Candidatus Limnocylindria bacterium]
MKPVQHESMRTTLLIQGARENNLRNITVEFPRNKLVIITGVSGSGKSSLAFDTLYAEGQRRLLASMSAYAKRFVNQLRKPDVDFVQGLSPVISIDQKTVGNNPRSTIGTMTDLWDYLRMLYATLGAPHCPRCQEAVATRSPRQMLERMLQLPPGTTVELRAPVFEIFGESWEHTFEQVRLQGYRRVRVDGVERDLGSHFELGDDEHPFVEAILDRFVVGPGIDRHVLAAIEHGSKVGDGFFSFHADGLSDAQRKKFWKDFGCAEHHLISTTLHHGNFTFNDPAGACRTCGGLGTSKRVHPTLLVPDPSRSLGDGAIVKEAFNHDKNAWGGRWLHSLAQHYGFSLETPFSELPETVKDLIFQGTKGEKIEILMPPGARQGEQHSGKKMSFQGVIPQIERNYRWYRKQGQSRDGMEEYLQKVMVDYDCPDCGGARLRQTRSLVRVGDKTLPEAGNLHLRELQKWLRSLDLSADKTAVAATVLREIDGRVELLIGIGLDYLNLNRRSGTLSGGESQRIRLSTQIGSGLMGMLYVLDEPSIGLHPKDNAKMIATLERLRDLGNTVVVVEHDEDTIRAADWLIEIGPGPGIHGGHVMAQGPPAKALGDPSSLTGAYLRGDKRIEVPKKRRVSKSPPLRVCGARHNNLQNLDVDIPLGVLVCVTGASGSGKSSLVHDIVYQKLASMRYDSRIMAGAHDALHGHEVIDDVVDIDQSPIGRSPRSNPATYVGVYDAIRELFAETDEAKKRGFGPATFSFNVKGGRCEECAGDGAIVTQMSFMPDVEVVCPACKGSRYREETLEVTWQGRNIAEVLKLSIEESVSFFKDQRTIVRKLETLHELGLGYLELGHAATILSGGEAQRVKLAAELGKLRRGRHNLYILDEPTTGLHFADIQRLLDCLQRLVEAGHSVLVIEHHLDVIKCADWVLDLGPTGGHQGGRLMVAGTPETVAKCAQSHTGQALREHLKKK